MSVYTWGSSAHGGGLGFISSHSVNEINIPRNVNLGKSKIERCFTGRGFTVALTCDGCIYRWGSQYSLLPEKVELDFPVGSFSACYESGDLLFIKRGTNEVYTSANRGTVRPLIHNGRLLYAREVSSLRKWHCLIVDKDTGKLMELTRGHLKEYLSPSAMASVADSFDIFADGNSGFCCAHQRGTGHLRVWSQSLSPAKVCIQRSNRNTRETDWQRSDHQFYLKDVKSVCFSGINGYAVSHGELVRFDISGCDERSTLFGTAISCRMNGALTELLSVSIYSTNLLILTAQGDCYCLDAGFDADSIELSEHVPILSQATGVWSSSHHVAAVVQVFPYIDTVPDEGPSLQRACSKTIMRSMVTVENVVDLLHVFLSRPVIDMPYLLLFAVSFYKLNRPLIACLRSASVKELDAWEQFRVALEEHDMHGGSFVDILMRVRCRLGESCCEDVSCFTETSSVGDDSVTYPSDEISVVDVPSSNSTQIPSSSSFATPILTPVIALHSDQLSESGLFGSDDFLPLSDAATQGMGKECPHSFDNKRVRKWKKKPLDQSLQQAPWVSPQLMPSSPPLSKVMSDEASMSVSRSLPSGSRWFTPDRPQGYSVGDLIRQEQEEREAMEAVRLVEEYERAVAAHQACENNRSNPRKRGYIKQKHRGTRDACK